MVFPKGGGESLLTALNKQRDIHAFPIRRVNANSLKKCDVLIITQKTAPLRLIRAVGIIIKWVENGGGVLFTHDSVGYRKHMSMFRDIGGGINHPKLDKVKVIKAHPVTRGLSVGQVFPPGFRYDHIALVKGPAGTTLIENEQGDPVVVVGPFGKGKVILNGMLTGMAGDKKAAGGRESEPIGEELKLLINSVQWLSEKGGE